MLLHNTASVNICHVASSPSYSYIIPLFREDAMCTAVSCAARMYSLCLSWPGSRTPTPAWAKERPVVAPEAVVSPFVSSFVHRKRLAHIRRN